MRARTRSITATLAVAATTVGIAAGVVHGAPEPDPAPVAAPPAAAAPDAGTVAVARLTRLDDEADAAGLAAQEADEALLQHRTASTEHAADAAHDALVALAGRQQPQLAAVAQVLGAAAVAAGGEEQATAEGVARSSASRALKAVSFARHQLGKPYRYAGAGPRAYDCSGLTMRAYRAAGESIGGHGATKQWRLAQQHHRLHSYRSVRRGDLIFYGRPGAVYHVAIYSGHGRMIEAPYPGKPVREVKVRSAGRLAQVARPA